MVGCFAAMFGITVLSVGPGIVAMNGAAIQASNCVTLPQHRRRTTTMTAALRHEPRVGSCARSRPELIWSPSKGTEASQTVPSPDGKTLFVANAAENAVAVVDADAKAAEPDEDGDCDEQGDEATAVRGLIPTGWYPTAVALDAGGQHLFIASGYGFGSIAPTDPPDRGRSYQHRKGVVSILDVPGRSELEQFRVIAGRPHRTRSSRLQR